MERTNVKMLLKTFAQTPFGLFSVLTCGELKLYTVEPPYNNNIVNESAIPAGIYDVGRLVLPAEDDKWQVMNVNERTEIMIHAGNRAIESKGCIIVGTHLGCVEGEWAVMDSLDAMIELGSALDDVGEFKLYIDRSIINQEYNHNDRSL